MEHYQSSRWLRISDVFFPGVQLNVFTPWKPSSMLEPRIILFLPVFQSTITAKTFHVIVRPFKMSNTTIKLKLFLVNDALWLLDCSRIRVNEIHSMSLEDFSVLGWALTDQVWWNRRSSAHLADKLHHWYIVMLKFSPDVVLVGLFWRQFNGLKKNSQTRTHTSSSENYWRGQVLLSLTFVNISSHGALIAACTWHSLHLSCCLGTLYFLNL